MLNMHNSLVGYTHTCGKIIGGIKSVALIERCQVESASLDPKSDVYNRIDLKTSCSFTNFKFGEGAARYNETFKREKGNISVTHTLEFVLDRMDNVSREVLCGIAAASSCGLIAVVTTANNVSYMVGYSEELLNERPLRIHGAEGTSGMKYFDKSTETVVLRSIDVAKARLFTGSI